MFANSFFQSVFFFFFSVFLNIFHKVEVLNFNVFKLNVFWYSILITFVIFINYILTYFLCYASEFYEHIIKNVNFQVSSQLNLHLVSQTENLKFGI